MTSDTNNPNGGGHHGVGHIVPVRYLMYTGIALLVLTVVTVAIAKIDFGKANVFVALAIAVLKASLVVLFFMHLRWDRPFNALVFITSISLVVLFISFALTDTVEYGPSIDTDQAPKVLEKLTETSSG